ncbi:hypothetical protein [Cupriavidus malaysiensis]|uniref:Uncharacterized protein n=1 Tax=Cupriavidus malaysiensis TaxID=367825 RepID=A0ABM7D895_9BURK|nr:hypothetical protein [Cupriavidus malaysiensis]AOZ07503.1 hypothetical protein BKK80_17940 [Cupriavidus malaysiensis]
MIATFIDTWRGMRVAAMPGATEAARLRRKLWRKEIGLAVSMLGAAVVLHDAARALHGVLS